jgi:hypothetical protein
MIYLAHRSDSPVPITGIGASTDTFRSASVSANGSVVAFITSASLGASENDSSGPGGGAGPTGDREDVYVLR